MKTILYAGSFDPITLGHVRIVERSLEAFDKVLVLVSNSSEKKYMLKLDERADLCRKTFEGYPNVQVETHTGLTVEFARQNGISFMVRGVRNPMDFNYESNLNDINKSLAPDIDTLFLVSEQKFSLHSSSLVRELYRHNKFWQDLVPECVKEQLTALVNLNSKDD